MKFVALKSAWRLLGVRGGSDAGLCGACCAGSVGSGSRPCLSRALVEGQIPMTERMDDWGNCVGTRVPTPIDLNA